jgi:hypothetical protein
MYKKYFFIIFIIFLGVVLNSCVKNHFNINLIDNDDYNGIYILMETIQKNAVDKNLEYFKDIVKKTFYDPDMEIKDEDKEYYDHLKKSYGKDDYNYKDFFEFLLTKETERLMDDILRANILKTYKKRAYITYSYEGMSGYIYALNFDYHWDEKEIWFQMYIKREMEGRDWVLSSLWHCR